MERTPLRNWLYAGLCTFYLASPLMHAQVHSATGSQGELRLRIASSLPGKHHAVPVVAWLEPLPGTHVLPFPSESPYTLLQKNRTFIPHLQVVPVGTAVQFPNADLFFHNVFSLFNGKRFDLGLYEAGSSKSVTFPREGVSYIFCNIHPEMSAVVISLATSLYAIADTNHFIVLRSVPPGEYKLEVWVEGVPESILERLTQDIHIRAGSADLGELRVPIPAFPETHTDKFGHAYEQDSKPLY